MEHNVLIQSILK